MCVTHSCLTAAQASCGVKLRTSKARNRRSNTALHVGFFVLEIVLFTRGDCCRDINYPHLSHSFVVISVPQRRQGVVDPIKVC